LFAQQEISENPHTGCGLFSPHQIIIDDFLKYDVPELLFDDNLVNMEMTWGNPVINSAVKSAILQIELTTSVVESKQIPLNVCLVIDRSASMSEYRRMDKVKVAMKEFFKMLKPTDYASIVVYDDTAMILFPAQRMHDGGGYNYVAGLIDSIKLGASTNMVSGMTLGYKEVLKNYSPFSANRVILLTDGITNLGIIEPAAIIAQSKIYNDKGIDISTIGVGTDINFGLLNQIASEGCGLSHFIGDCDSVRNDAIRVFKEELNNMQSLVKDPVIEITFPKQFEASLVKDIIAEQHRKLISIFIKSLPQGMSQTSIIRFNINKKINKDIEFEVKLTYFDVLSRKTVSRTRHKRLLYSHTPNENIDMLDDINVKNNYYLTLMTCMLKKSVQEFEGKRYSNARHIINKCLADIDNKIDLSKPDSRQWTVRQMLLHQLQLVENILFRNR
jgi:Mg-chelatase subunit ChlD